MIGGAINDFSVYGEQDAYSTSGSRGTAALLLIATLALSLGFAERSPIMIALVVILKIIDVARLGSR